MQQYEVALNDDEGLLNTFLEKWSIPNIREMTLEQYTDVDNGDTFTQWVENRTSQLGSIRGRIGSPKFGLYKIKSKAPKNLYFNKYYTWIKYYGECNYDEFKVFEKIKGELLRLIQYAQELDFDAIEKHKGFYEIFKWKVAFLYSNQNLVPVFKLELLKKFTNEFGMNHNGKKGYADMHKFLFQVKPPNISVFNFMRQLFFKEGLIKTDSKPKRQRKGTDELNVNDYQRETKGKTSTVTSTHKKYQIKLREYLLKQYPDSQVTFEKNFIDILLVSESEVHYYEVKTSHSSEDCIKKGLGQLLSYSYYEEQVLSKYKDLKKKIVICGKLKPKPNDLKFIDYVNDSLKVRFEYLSLDEIG